MNPDKIIDADLTNWDISIRNEDLAYWIALNSVRDRSTIDIVKAMIRESVPVHYLWQENADHLAEKHHVNLESLKKLRVRFGKIHFQNILNDLGRMIGEGIRVVPITDPKFPKKLEYRSIVSHPTPLVMLEKGAEVNVDRAIAIVGTRNPSLKGRFSALELAENFAGKGYVVISGLARGVDEFAHVGAMKHPDGLTIGVLPWLGSIYPPEHESLAEDITKKGMLISDVYAISIPFGNKSRFIERNAIISGLSDFVVAIETDEEGGTIRAAEIAIKQGVKVYALHIGGNPRSERGYKKLIQMGAIGFDNITELEGLISDSKSQQGSLSADV